MSRFFLLSVFVAFCVAAVVIGCGSNWTISGNNLIVTPLQSDSLIKKGSYVITPVDTFINQKN